MRIPIFKQLLCQATGLTGMVGMALSLSLVQPVFATHNEASPSSKVDPRQSGRAIASKARISQPAKDSSSPEAGVQLLTDILRLVGSEGTQVAMKPQVVASADLPPSAANILQQHLLPQQGRQSDPANLIRPPVQSKKFAGSKVAGKLIPPPPSVPLSAESAPLVAMNNKQADSLRLDMLDNAPEVRDYREAKGIQVRGTKAKMAAGYYQPGAGGAANAASESGAGSLPGRSEGFARMRTAIGNLYKVTDTLGKAQQTAQVHANEEGDESSGAAADKKVININGPVRGKSLISSAGNVFEYSGNSQQGSVGAKSEDVEKPESQAAAYRTTKEYARRNLPVLAYVPPSMVAGIPGLRLGATESQVSAFLQGKGKVEKKSINGWTVWSLQDPESKQTTLQIYSRRGTVDALRIFNDEYVPGGLGVSIEDELKCVKEKFGEAKYMLPAPGNSKSGPAKNYVYPVSQISFQIGRDASGDKRKIVQNMLLFQFL